MTNKFLLNLLGLNPDLTSRQSRVDSVSILSRQSNLFTYLGRIAAILLLVLTIGVGNAWADTVVYSTGFESTTTDTNYKGTVTCTSAQGNGATWEIYYGNFTTDAVISGSKGAQMRLYSDNKCGTMTQTSNISNVDSVTFAYKCSNTNVRFKVQYSTNSGSTWTDWQTGLGGNTTTSYFKKKLATRAATFRLKIVVTGGHPTSSNRKLTIDDIVYKTVSDCDDPATALSVSAAATTIYAGVQTQLSTSGGNGSTITYSVTSANSTYATIDGSNKFSATQAGTYTVQASQDEDGGTCGGTATVNITVRYQVKWSVNGNDSYSTGSPTTYIGTHNTKVSTLPTDPTSAMCDNTKVFVGWTTSSYSHATNAPTTLFLTAASSPNVTDNVTYYAVFANRTDFTRVTSTSQLAAGKQIVVVDDQNSKVLTTAPGYATAPTESSSKITPSNNMIWTLEANSTNWKLKTSGSYLGASSTSNGTSVSLTSTNSIWTIGASSSGTNNFYLLNTGGTNLCLEYYSSGSSWVVYANKNYTSSTYFTEKLYVATLTNYATSCCTPLASINGSVSLTQGGTSVTVKEWSAVSNASSYTVKMYHYNTSTSEWDLVSGSSSSTSGAHGTKTAVTDRSTGVTFTGLTLNDDYKFSVTANGTGSYCDGDETFVDEINEIDVSSTPFNLSYSIYMDNGSGSGWTDHLLEDDGTYTATLGAGISYYQFGIRRGFDHGGWWAATSADNVYDTGDEEWTLNGSNNVRLQTFVGGSYIFAVDLSGANPKITITYPPANQAAGKIVYWDASIHGNNWTKFIFRVGTNSNSNAGADCKTDGQLVSGTDNFYKVTTAGFNDMRAWAIANNAGWTGAQTNGVYRTNDFGDYNVTKSTEYQDYVVGDGGVTLIPASEGTLGDKSYNNNCYFYPVTKTDGMLTHNVAIGAKPTGGSITITYTNTSGTSGQTVTDGNNADLAHRCILNVVATPETGYNLVTFTKNSSDFTGPNYILTEDVTFAATFTLKQTTVMLNNESATTAGASSVTATYSQAVPSIAANLPAKTGYVFGGYFTEKNGAGTQYINADGSSAQNWDIEDATKTLYAKWTPIRCTVTLTAGTGSNGEAKFDYDATAYYSFSPAVRVGWTCTGYWTETGGTGTKILEADGSRAANVAGWWVDGKWSVDNTSATLYAGWENTYGGDEFELVQDLSELSAGKKIVILDKDHAYALGTSGTNNRSSVAAAAASNAGFSMSGDNNVVTLASATAVQVITLESSGASNRYYMNVENGYLYANGTSSNNYLKTRANNETNAEQGQFLFGLTDGDFTIRAQSGDSYNTYLREYSTSTFSCYSTAASNKAVLVYVKRESCDDPATALSVSASPSAISTATGYNTSTLSTANGNGNDVVYSVISANKANATISGTTTKTFSASAAGTYTVQAFQLKNENICRQIATTDITVTTPVLTTSKNSHTFEKTKTGSSRTTNTVTISGTNLVENVSVTYTGDTEYFTVTPSSISASDAMSSAQALTITYAPTVAGSHSITITISSTGAVDKTVTVNGTAADFFDVTFHISGSADVVRQVESGEKPVLPDNPASCDATSTAFIGWATAPWVGKIASVSDKTIHTSNATMSAVTAATDYYAVWAKEDASANVANAWAVINEDFANASAGSAGSGASSTLWPNSDHPSSVVIDKSYAYEAGGTVKLGTGSYTGYIQTRAIPASAGAKIRIAFKVKGWSSVEGDIKITSDDSQFSEQTVTYSNNYNQSFESKYVDVTVAAGKSNPKIKIATSAKRAFIDDVVISVYYSDYLTTCCENTGLTFGTILSPVTSYEIVRTSSAAATIDCNFESSTATAITWYKTSRAARTFVTPTGATSSTAPSSQLAEMTIDIANKKLTASSVGVYTITIKQDEATIAGQKYCESFAEVTVTVKVRDRFVDLMNGEAVDADDGNPTITKDDTGGGIYTPTESEFSEDDICKSTRRKLIGWIKESDLNTGYAGRVNDITDMKTDNPATNKVIAPNTQVVATGCTWYAVWADID